MFHTKRKKLTQYLWILLCCFILLFLCVSSHYFCAVSSHYSILACQCTLLLLVLGFISYSVWSFTQENLEYSSGKTMLHIQPLISPSNLKQPLSWSSKHFYVNSINSSYSSNDTVVLQWNLISVCMCCIPSYS